MLQWLRLLLKRVLVFVVVASLAYITCFVVYPYIDNHTPTLVAIIATYFVMAYGIIPTFIRIFRIFDKPNHIPTCAITGDGWQSDPVNVAILANSKADFVAAMRSAGWHTADKKNLKNSLKIVCAIVLNRPYDKAPFSNLYLFGRKQDIGFQMAVGNSPRKRHHIRFWKVTNESLLADERSKHQHLAFWHKLLAKFWSKKQELWVGACLYDSGAVAILWRNGQINHKNHPDADSEREFLIESLKKSGAIKDKVISVKSGAPYRHRGQNLGLTIISDGNVKLCQVKRQPRS